MPRVIRPLLVLVLVPALVALLAGCRTDSEPGDGSAASRDGDGPSDGHDPDAPADGQRSSLRPRVNLPDDSTTVLPDGDAGELALATSRALYDHAPVALLAAHDDLGAQTRAASVAVRVGAPLLLVPGAPPEEPDGPPGEELDRLGTRTVVTFDDASTRWAGNLDRDLAVSRAPSDPTELAPLAGRPSAAARTVAPADVTVAVAALRREGSVMIDVDAPADPAGSEATGGEPPTELPAAAAGTGPNEALSQLEAAAPLDSLVVLSSPGEAEVAATATARAAGARVLVMEDADPRADEGAIAALAGRPVDSVVAFGDGFGDPDRLRRRVEVAATGLELPGGGQVLFPGRRMVALYGHPTIPALGALGEQPLDDAIRRAEQVAADYEPLSDEPVVPTFEIIASIASAGPGADGSYSDVTPVDELRPWVEAARDADMYVVLDLQPGRTDFLAQARHYEELLVEPHVGLALDPEWRLEPDQVHLQQIGSVDADEVNAVAAWLAELTREHRLPQKLLVLHQFRLAMIADRDQLDTSWDELTVLIHADGHGTPGMKYETWDALTASPPPDAFWGWKNFIDEDNPMMSPEETMAVEPTPLFISYQ